MNLPQKTTTLLLTFLLTACAANSQTPTPVVSTKIPTITPTIEPLPTKISEYLFSPEEELQILQIKQQVSEFYGIELPQSIIEAIRFQAYREATELDPEFQNDYSIEKPSDLTDEDLIYVRNTISLLLGNNQSKYLHKVYINDNNNGSGLGGNGTFSFSRNYLNEPKDTIKVVGHELIHNIISDFYGRRDAKTGLEMLRISYEIINKLGGVYNVIDNYYYPVIPDQEYQNRYIITAKKTLEYFPDGITFDNSNTSEEIYNAYLNAVNLQHSNRSMTFLGQTLLNSKMRTPKYKLNDVVERELTDAHLMFWQEAVSTAIAEVLTNPELQSNHELVDLIGQFFALVREDNNTNGYILIDQLFSPLNVNN